jgi:hypothetical protein
MAASISIPTQGGQEEQKNRRWIGRHLFSSGQRAHAVPIREQARVRLRRTRFWSESQVQFESSRKWQKTYATQSSLAPAAPD